jgi:hypothetical protein
MGYIEQGEEVKAGAEGGREDGSLLRQDDFLFGWFGFVSSSANLSWCWCWCWIGVCTPASQARKESLEARYRTS